MNKFIGIVLILTLAACSKSPESPQESSNADSATILEAKDMSITGNLSMGEFQSKDSSKLVSYTIKNNGTETLTGPVTLSDNTNFYLVYQNCNSVAKTKSCSVKISFDPKGKSGPYSTALNLDTLSAQVTASVAVPAPPTSLVKFLVSSVDVGTSGVDFGTITDKQSSLKTITIKNDGLSVISGQSLSFSNGASPYTISYDACSGKDLAKGSSCSVKINLAGAGKSGAQSSGLVFAGKTLNLTGQVTSSTSSGSGSSGSGGSSGSVVLGFFNGSTALSSSYDFGTLSGSSSKVLVLTIKNTGSLSFSGGVVSSSSTDFSVLTNSCDNKSLSIGASCQIRISFSASGKQNNSYSGSISLGGSSLNLTGTVSTQSAVITYAAQYSLYGTCSAQVCEGSGTQSRTISACRKLSNGVDAGAADISLCSSFNTPANLQQSCLSLAGQKTVAVSNGSKLVSCTAGSSVQNLVSLTCDSGFNNDNGSCVADIITFSPNYSDFSSCPAQACDGYGMQSRSLTSCQKILNGTPVSGGQLSDCAVYDTVGYLEQPCPSPAGEKTLAIDNGSRIVSCPLGSSVQSFVSISCDNSSSPTGYHYEDTVSCISNTRSCNPIPDHATVATEIYNNSSSSWGSCNIVTCDSNYDLTGGVCVAQGGSNPNSVELSVTVSNPSGAQVGNGDQSEISISPSPLTKVQKSFNGIIFYRYTFSPGVSSITVTANPSSSMSLNYFSGDCSGASCVLDMSSSKVKAVLAVYKETNSKFQFVETGSNQDSRMCVTASTNMGIGTNPGFMTGEECESSDKQVSWSSYDCSSFSEMDCNTHQGCYYDNMGGGFGGGGGYDCSWYSGGDSYYCQAQPGCWYNPQYNDCSMNSDEFSCQSNTMGACYWQSYGDPENPSMGSCQGGQYQVGGYCEGGWQFGGGGGSCQGGFQGLCQDQNGNNLYVDEANCNSASLTGTYAMSNYLGGGVGGTFSSQSYSTVGNNSFFFNNNALRKINLTTNSASIVSAGGLLDTSDTTYNGKYYFMQYDGTTKVKYTDGSSVETVPAPGVAEVDVAGQAAFLNSSMQKMVVAGDGVYFTQENYYNNFGGRLWKIDVNNNLSLAYQLPTGQKFDYKLYVATKDKVFICKSLQLFAFDTASKNLTALNQSCSSNFYSWIFSVIDYDSNQIAFYNNDANKMAVSNGTAAGTYVVSTTPGNYAIPFYYNGGLFFKSYASNGVGQELYKSSGTPATSFGMSSLFADLRTGTPDSSPSFIGGIGGKVLVKAYDGSSYNVFAVDTTNGSFSNLTNASNVSSGDNYIFSNYDKPISGVTLGSFLYFTFNNKLYKTDGTAGGTSLISGLQPNSAVYYIMKAGTKLLMIISTSTAGYQMVVYDPN